MNKVECVRCHNLFPAKKTVQIFDAAGSIPETLCMDCYYDLLAEQQIEINHKKQEQSHGVQ